MRSSSKQSTDNNNVNAALFRRKFYNRFLPFSDDSGRIRDLPDIMTQELVYATDAYLDYLNTDTSKNTFLKSTISDMVEALTIIFQLKNENVLISALKVAQKMAIKLPSFALKLIHPLTSLVSYTQWEAASLASDTLKMILSSGRTDEETEIWNILDKTNTIVQLVNNIRDCSSGNKPARYFENTASLLSDILWRWPPSRFRVWNDVEFLEVLKGISLKTNPVKVALLRLYSSIALCGNGRQKLLKNGELINMMVHSMNCSDSQVVQIEGFKLARILSMDEQCCFQLMKLCCKPIIKAIIRGMSRTQSGKVAKDLLVEACRLALIVRWPGQHHDYFWKRGVDNVLVNLLLNDYLKSSQSEDLLSVFTVMEGLNADSLILRPYIWDILGWLATHCDKDFNPESDENQLCINNLMQCACIAFVDSMHKTHQYHLYGTARLFYSEPAARSVLMMIYSPCKYITSKVRSILEELLQKKVKGKEYLIYLLDHPNGIATQKDVQLPDRCQTMMNVMHLACFSALQEFQKYVAEGKGVKSLLTFIRWSLQNHLEYNVHVRRSTMAPHLHTFHERICCRVYEEPWGHEDLIFLYGLWGLAEVMHHSGFDIYSCQKDFNVIQLIDELEECYISISTPGASWYAAYIRKHFGVYGFPSKLGKKIGRVLNESECTDLDLILTNEESFSVHGIILKVRCPALLPRHDNERHKTGNSKKLKNKCQVSDCVDREALSKVLEYVYSGHFQAGRGIMKSLTTFANSLNLKIVLELLSRKSPKWGTPIPSFDLTNALEPAGQCFADVILEAKANEMMNWMCRGCSLTVPHMHCHTIIVCSSCEYLRSMFRSGMQESKSKTIKVPISWDALVILCHWFYSGLLTKPVSGCFLANLEFEKQLDTLLPYKEIQWISDYWCLDDLRADCDSVLSSCLLSVSELANKRLLIKMNQFTDELIVSQS
ncbi:BTB/POZ domain-containing protein At1g04390-like [Cornus florida]|uniref:BTB/POZ domain-containing protein At1g04390-like n=1 Tax=Cornus florida TaxID=4283 RepID=UPI00289B7B94|nr:BTB/POZ domain-containing protein At1g04390-like [Cornus florida]